MTANEKCSFLIVKSERQREVFFLNLVHCIFIATIIIANPHTFNVPNTNFFVATKLFNVPIKIIWALNLYIYLYFIS